MSGGAYRRCRGGGEHVSAHTLAEEACQNHVEPIDHVSGAPTGLEGSERIGRSARSPR